MAAGFKALAQPFCKTSGGADLISSALVTSVLNVMPAPRSTRQHCVITSLVMPTRSPTSKENPGQQVFADFAKGETQHDGDHPAGGQQLTRQ